MYCIYCTIYCSTFRTICLLFSLFRLWEVARAKRKTFTISALAVRQRILRNLIQGFQYELLLAAVKFVKIFCCLRYIFNSPTHSISTSSMLSLSSWVILCLFVMVFFRRTKGFSSRNLCFPHAKPMVCVSEARCLVRLLRVSFVGVFPHAKRTCGCSCFYNWSRTQLYSPHPKRR